MNPRLNESVIIEWWWDCNDWWEFGSQACCPLNWPLGSNIFSHRCSRTSSSHHGRQPMPLSCRWVENEARKLNEQMPNRVQGQFQPWSWPLYLLGASWRICKPLTFTVYRLNAFRGQCKLHRSMAKRSIWTVQKIGFWFKSNHGANSVGLAHSNPILHLIASGVNSMGA